MTNLSHISPYRTDIIRGGGWMTALQIGRRAIITVATIVLARLLAPDDFGLFAIGLITLNLFLALTDAGILRNLTQQSQVDDDLLNTAWTWEAIRGVLVFAALYGLAQPISSMLREPGATPFIRTMGLVALFRGVRHTRIVQFQRELRFDRVFVLELAGSVVSMIAAIWVAVRFRSPWALIVGPVGDELVQTVVSYVYFPQPPRPVLRIRDLRRLYQFGKWFQRSAFVSFCHMNGEKLFVQLLLGHVALGLYTYAWNVSGMLAREMKQVTDRIMFPVYSRGKEEYAALQNLFSRSMVNISSSSIFLCVVGALLSVDFVEVLLGPKWAELRPVLPVMFLAAAVRSVDYAKADVFLALNRPHANFLVDITQLAALVIFIPALSVVMQAQLQGIAFALLAANTVSTAVSLWLIQRHVSVSPASLLRGIAGQNWDLLLLVPVWYVLTTVMPPSPTRFLAIGSTALVLHSLSALTSYRSSRQGLLELLPEQIRLRLTGSF